MASRPPRSVPTRGNQEAPLVSLSSGPYKLQADLLFEGLEKGVFGPMVCLDLFVVVGMLAEPVVRHFSRDLGRLPLVATADDLDASTLEQVEEDIQSGAGHCLDLVPDDHAEDELLGIHLVEEAMVGLGLDALSPYFFGQTLGRSESRGFLRRKRSIAHMVLPLTPPPFR